MTRVLPALALALLVSCSSGEDATEPAPATDAPVDTIPVGELVIELPEGATAGSGDSPDSVTVATTADDCTIAVSSEGIGEGGPEHVETLAGLFDGVVEPVTLPSSSGEVHEAAVVRLPPGVYGATAHVSFDQPDGDLVDITCGELATAEALLDEVRLA